MISEQGHLIQPNGEVFLSTSANKLLVHYWNMYSSRTVKTENCGKLSRLLTLNFHRMEVGQIRDIKIEFSLEQQSLSRPIIYWAYNVMLIALIFFKKEKRWQLTLSICYWYLKRIVAPLSIDSNFNRRTVNLFFFFWE